MSTHTPAHSPAPPRAAGECAACVLMVRPRGFRYNPETAQSNTQAHTSELDPATIEANAMREFEAVVHELQLIGITTIVVDPPAGKDVPDAVFPNNWISTHANGTIVLYPMRYPSRQREIREDMHAVFAAHGIHGYRPALDLTSYVKAEFYLEGTGSLVLDRTHRVAYAALSERTNAELVREWCRLLGYGTTVMFKAFGNDGTAVYHTNVLMAIGEKFAVICASAIRDDAERADVLGHLARTGRTIVEISPEQMRKFAGNIIELCTPADKRVVLMSERARAALRPDQLAALTAATDMLVSIPVATIEEIGGGGIRCMIAEVMHVRTGTLERFMTGISGVMPRTRDVVSLLLGATLGLLAARFNEYLHHDGRIATVAFAENRVTAYNASGVVIWQRGMPATINHAALTTGDDSTQQYVAVACEPQDRLSTNLNIDNGGKLIMLAADGSNVWTYGVDERCVFDDSTITYRGLRPVEIVTIHHHGTPVLAVLFQHYHFACSFLVELRTVDKRKLGSYWNRGLGGYISRIADFGRTKEYLLWWNVPNNSLQSSRPDLYGHGPFRNKHYPLNAILFDPDDIHGTSPSTINNDGCTIAKMPGYGSELWYATYQWTDSMLGPEIQARAYDDPVRRSVVIEIKTNQQLYQVALDGSRAKGMQVLRPECRTATDVPPPYVPQPYTKSTVDTPLAHQRKGVWHHDKGHPPSI